MGPKKDYDKLTKIQFLIFARFTLTVGTILYLNMI